MAAIAALIGIVLLAICPRTYGQAISVASFGQSDGLKSLEDNCLLQDHLGFVYVCTENGLFVFDGSTFQRIGSEQGLDGSFISALHQDANQRLWVGTRTGLFVGDGQYFSHVEAPVNPLIIDPGATLADLHGRLFAVSRHKLWIIDSTASGWRGKALFDSQALNAMPALADISSVYATGQALWFGCGSALCQWTGDHTRVWSAVDGIPSDKWTSYLLDREGTLWVRSPHYIRALAPGAQRFSNHDLTGAHVVTAYLDMVEDDQGRLLTRSDTGLARWDGNAWQRFDKHNGLPDIGIDALLYDRSHVLWIGTYGRGVLQWRGYGQIKNWQAAQGLDSSPTWAIARSASGALWVGDELGGSLLRPGATALAPWPIKAPPHAQEVIAIQALTGGDMLVAYYSGELLRYHAQSDTTELAALSPAYIRFVKADRSGALWLCTERGIETFDGKTLSHIRNDVVPDDAFSDVSSDSNGRLWFVGDSGLFRFMNGHWTRVHIVGAPADSSFSHIDVLPNGNFYLSGNFAGLWRGRISDADTFNVKHIDDPLIDDSRIYFIRHDQRGWLWVGGTTGVEIFNGWHWRRLTQDDGLAWDDVTENAYYEDGDGSIWIGTANGISHIPHPDNLATLNPLSIRITGIDLNSVRQRATPFYRFDHQSVHGLSLHLAALDAPTRRTLRFRYRLKGLDQNWVSSERPQIDYPPLPPGQYTFEASVVDPDSRQTSAIVSLPIQIIPPWWQSTLALIGGTGLALLVILFAWTQRTRHLHLRTEKLTRLVTLRTHELELDKRALEETRAALWYQANHDALTGLLSRSHVLSRLDHAISHARSSYQELAVALIDMDHFKRINDAFGHLAGDQVLAEAATRLSQALPPKAILGRYGGEEVLAVAPGVARNQLAPFEALRHCINALPFSGDGNRIEVTCSMGIAWLSPRDEDARDIVRRADAALYMAKRSGRNRVVVAEEASSMPETDEC